MFESVEDSLTSPLLVSHPLLEEERPQGEPNTTTRRGRKTVARTLALWLVLAMVAIAIWMLEHKEYNETTKPPPSLHYYGSLTSQGPSTVAGRSSRESKEVPFRPTLLSLVDPDTNLPINVDDHKLYAKIPQFVSPNIPPVQGVEQSPKGPTSLTWSKSELSEIEEAVTLSWPSKVRDDDLLVLWCKGHQEGAVERVLEVATVAQARATSRRNHRRFDDSSSKALVSHDDTTSWFMPSFPLTRFQACYAVLYEEHQDQAHLPVAQSPPLSLVKFAQIPTQLHLSFGDTSPSQMVVQFNTAAIGTPVASVGTHNPPSTKFEGTSTTYTASDLCKAPANQTEAGKFMDPGQWHTVVLDNLQPDTHYYYKVGLASGQGIVWSDVYDFVSEPAVGSFGSEEETSYQYIVYGDQGNPSDGWAPGGGFTSSMLATETQARSVHHFGDLSYACGTAHIWDEWLSMIQVFATKLPLMVGVGNHEYDHTSGGVGRDPSGLNASHGYMPKWGNYGEDSGGECGVPTAKRFRAPFSTVSVVPSELSSHHDDPTEFVTSNGVFWYSFDSATVHTVVLSSEHDLSKGSRQYQWLEADLAVVNRTLTPWVVVELHRSLYMNVADWGNNNVELGLRHSIEGLLKDYQVDLVLSGHFHSYFRSCAGLFQSQCDNGGPTHITVGTAGAPSDLFDGYDTHWAKANVQGVFGYGRITVSNQVPPKTYHHRNKAMHHGNATGATAVPALHFELVQAAGDGDPNTGKVLDEVWLYKE